MHEKARINKRRTPNLIPAASDKAEKPLSTERLSAGAKRQLTLYAMDYCRR